MGSFSGLASPCSHSPASVAPYEVLGAHSDPSEGGNRQNCVVGLRENSARIAIREVLPETWLSFGFDARRAKDGPKAAQPRQ